MTLFEHILSISNYLKPWRYISNNMFTNFNFEVAHDNCLYVVHKSHNLYAMINSTSLILVIIRVMTINIINMKIRLQHIIDKSDKSLEAFSLFPIPMLHLLLLKIKHKLAQSYPTSALLVSVMAPMIQMDFGVSGMVSILGVVGCSCIATNPGSTEQQDFGSLHTAVLLYIYISFHNYIV